MKNRGIWMIICSIVIVGVFVTMSTRWFVVSRTASADETIPMTAAESSVPETTAEPQVNNTPLGTLPVESTEEVRMGYQEYLEHLAALDEQIEEARLRETSANTSTARTQAEKELNLWENELEYVSGVLFADMPKEMQDTFTEAQLNWRKERESAAAAASGRYAGSTMEAVEYTRSLTETTRMRVYELAEEL